jgi:hypothetical protein
MLHRGSRMKDLDAKAWLWFLSSYAPLWVMLGLRFSSSGLRYGLVALGIACFALVARLLTRRAGERVSDTDITVTGDAGSEVSGYLAAYLLPFLTVDRPDAYDLAAYAIFLWVAGLVYIRSGLMQINPTVYLLHGRRVLRAEIGPVGKTREVFVITARELRVGTILKGERFADRVYLHHDKDS